MNTTADITAKNEGAASSPGKRRRVRDVFIGILAFVVLGATFVWLVWGTEIRRNQIPKFKHRLKLTSIGSEDLEVRGSHCQLEDNGIFWVRIYFDNSLAGERYSGIDYSDYLYEFELSVVAGDQVLHRVAKRKFTHDSAALQVRTGPNDSAAFRSGEEYLQNGAELILQVWWCDGQQIVDYHEKLKLEEPRDYEQFANIGLWAATVFDCPGDSTSNAIADWQVYTSQNKAFTVEFPSAPEPWETEFNSPEYGHIDVYHVSAELDHVTYGVAYNNYPRDLTDAEVASELKNAYTLPGTGAEILETTEIEVAGSPAIEVISKTGPVFMTERFFMTDVRRLYSLNVGSDRDPREDRRLIDRFFQSFQLHESLEKAE